VAAALTVSSMTITVAGHGAGALVRDWRQRCRLSQMDLALEAGVSTRHLSFVETGRAKPSPELLLALADRLQVPLRERNSMLLAAGLGTLSATVPSGYMTVSRLAPMPTSTPAVLVRGPGCQGGVISSRTVQPRTIDPSAGAYLATPTTRLPSPHKHPAQTAGRSGP
jgi:DNA-binding XRE family transcriptional regulator